MVDKFGDVETFAKAWLAKRLWRPPFANAIHTTEIAHSLVLFRTGQYQVELYISKPNTQTPMHSHPDVESVTVYLTGNLCFSRDGVNFTDNSQYQKAKPNGAHALLWHMAEANKGEPHILRVGAEGGAILVFEKWLKGEPTSVSVNWIGDLIGEEHARLMENG